MYLLDTNVISELRKVRIGTCNPSVMLWADRLDQRAFYLSVITVLEMQIGLLRLERIDKRQAATLREWVHGYVLSALRDRILQVDVPIALRCAAFHVPDRRPERDALIAATAAEHGLIVATRNIKDFESTGVACLNPWEFGHAS
ncbi:type II toxin-antitoxin system VapC family toxin [Rhizobium sp. YIM 134829]|uniref:type II toxin-antitoxin system VapC family toxin n=1 Tax=Rhizobium sp. YIM 134829 TaxID=3390453 RepID=UPI00397C5C32